MEDYILVTRCKECKNSKQDKIMVVGGVTYIWCNYNEHYKHPNGFCDFGKKGINNERKG